MKWVERNLQRLTYLTVDELMVKIKKKRRILYKLKLFRKLSDLALAVQCGCPVAKINQKRTHSEITGLLGHVLFVPMITATMRP